MRRRWAYFTTSSTPCLPVSTILLIGGLWATPAQASFGCKGPYASSDMSGGLPPKGALATVFCSGLRGIDGVQVAKGYPLPTELAGVRVRVQGELAPLLAVADFGTYQQVNFQNPAETDDRGIVPPAMPPWTVYELEITQGEVSQIGYPYRNPGPALFQDANGFALAQHAADYSLITEDNPARPGEYVILYATGVVSYSQVNNAPALGEPASFDPLAWTRPASAYDSRHLGPYMFLGRVGSSEPYFVVPSFVGLMPGAAGVFQINFQVPEDAQTGRTSIIIGRGYYERVDPFRPDRFISLNGQSALIPVRR